LYSPEPRQLQEGSTDIVTALQPLIIGEVLFDHFPDGQRVLGGAPFNVAWNLRGLELDPVFVSAVGADDEGREVCSRMESWGLNTSELQVREEWPTGKVQVELDEGQPTFQILDKQAYDNIRFPPNGISSSQYSLIYTGSLAYRNEVTRSTIRRLIDESGLPRFVDINIRQPWFDRAWIPDLIGNARWIKLNDEELSWIAETECGTSEKIRSAVEKLRRLYGGQRYFITCGSAGAYAVSEAGDVLFAEAPTPDPFVDSVGAGDAFAAAVIFGDSLDRPLDEILQSAVRFASRACTIQGATTRDRGHYLPFET
jgi:fructokinase